MQYLFQTGVGQNVALGVNSVNAQSNNNINSPSTSLNQYKSEQQQFSLDGNKDAANNNINMAYMNTHSGSNAATGGWDFMGGSSNVNQFATSSHANMVKKTSVESQPAVSSQNNNNNDLL